MWTKYDYLCTDCDALIEITAKIKPSIDPACICEAQSHVIMIGHQDVTQLTAPHLDSALQNH
jgi:hypothetical protein